MRLLFLAVIALLLASCASVKKVESGSRTVGERMTVVLDGEWNHLDFPGLRPAQVWTMEGLAVDEFLIYSGIKDGERMHPPGGGSGKKDFVFRSGMQNEEAVALLEGVLSRDDATFKLLRLAPYTFGGKKGFRFEYERIRKVDNVQLRGVGFGALDKGELFALVYHAPRLTFFPRHLPRVEAIAQTVTIR
jgi:hypothetical protein